MTSQETPLIDPLISLAYSIHANPGVYALLIGSGVSRSASIPTGWEIVLDLVSKLAYLQQENCDPDPAAWYRDKYGKDPDYSELLDSLARSPEERQQLLASYFEPSDAEKEEGLKSPTPAHRSIANLVASGHIRVILTTNFDRLLERAIEDEGVTPVVLSTPDSIQGSIPLVHQRSCIIKLHGDYLDTRIKNTTNELDEYAPQINAILDRVLDEFGMIVCGWSGQWDSALRSAFNRCASRRFSTYWGTRGDLAPDAKRVLESRGGVLVRIRDADTFFAELAEKVSALNDLRQPHPLSVAVAAATTKRLLADEKHTIRLHDLVAQETEKCFQALQPIFETFLTMGNQRQNFQTRLPEMRACIEILRTIAVHGSYWGRPKQFQPYIAIPGRLAADPKAGLSGTHVTSSIRFIPSVMTLYSMGIAALAGANYAALATMLAVPAVVVLGERRPYLEACDWDEMQGFFRMLPPHERHRFPASEWLFADCRSTVRDLVPDDNEYERLFDHFEVVRSLVYIDISLKGAYQGERERFWGPGGRFVWKKASRLGREADVLEQVKSNEALGDGLCDAGLFAKRREQFTHVVDGFRPTVEEMAHRW